MKLLTKDNKLYVYDEFSDKFYLINEDDIDFVIDDSATTEDGKPKLLNDDIVRKYLSDKYGPKKRMKNVITKKIDVKKQADSAKNEIYDNALTNALLGISNIHGEYEPVYITDEQRLKILKNPTLSTVKKLGLNESEYAKIQRNYNKFKNNGFVTRNINKSDSLFGILGDLIELQTDSKENMYNKAFKLKQDTIVKDIEDKLKIAQNNRNSNEARMNAKVEIENLLSQLRDLLEEISVSPNKNENTLTLNGNVRKDINKYENAVDRINIGKVDDNTSESEDFIDDNKKVEVKEVKEVKPVEPVEVEEIKEIDIDEPKPVMQDLNNVPEYDSPTWKNILSHNDEYDKLNRILAYVYNTGRLYKISAMSNPKDSNNVSFKIKDDDDNAIFEVTLKNFDNTKVSQAFKNSILSIRRDDNIEQVFNKLTEIPKEIVKNNLTLDNNDNDVKVSIKPIANDLSVEDRAKFLKTAKIFDPKEVDGDKFYQYMINEANHFKEFEPKLKYKPYSINNNIRRVDKNFAYPNTITENITYKQDKGKNYRFDIPRLLKNFKSTTNNDKLAVLANILYSFDPDWIDDTMKNQLSTISNPTNKIKKLFNIIGNEENDQHFKDLGYETKEIGKIKDLFGKYAKQIEDDNDLNTKIINLINQLSKNQNVYVVPKVNVDDDYQSNENPLKPDWGDIQEDIYYDYVYRHPFGEGRLSSILAAKLNKAFKKKTPNNFLISKVLSDKINK